MVPEFHRVSGHTFMCPVADCTASGEFHPALKTLDSVVLDYYMSIWSKLQANIFFDLSQAIFLLSIAKIDKLNGSWFHFSSDLALDNFYL